MNFDFINLISKGKFIITDITIKFKLSLIQQDSAVSKIKLCQSVVKSSISGYLESINRLLTSSCPTVQLCHSQIKINANYS